MVPGSCHLLIQPACYPLCVSYYTVTQDCFKVPGCRVPSHPSPGVGSTVHPLHAGQLEAEYLAQASFGSSIPAWLFPNMQRARWEHSAASLPTQEGGINRQTAWKTVCQYVLGTLFISFF